MIHAETVPIPSTWIAHETEDDAEQYPVGVGSTRQDAIDNYFEYCLEKDSDYTSDSPEFAEFIKNY